MNFKLMVIFICQKECGFSYRNVIQRILESRNKNLSKLFAKAIFLLLSLNKCQKKYKKINSPVSVAMWSEMKGSDMLRMNCSFCQNCVEALCGRYSVWSVTIERQREKKGKNAKKYKIMLSCARSYCSKWYNWFRALIKQYFHHLSLSYLSLRSRYVLHTRMLRENFPIYIHTKYATPALIYDFSTAIILRPNYTGAFYPWKTGCVWLVAMRCGVLWCGVWLCSYSYSQSFLLFTADGRPDTDSLTHISNHHVTCIHYRFGMPVLFLIPSLPRPPLFQPQPQLRDKVRLNIYLRSNRIGNVSRIQRIELRKMYFRELHLWQNNY